MGSDDNKRSTLTQAQFDYLREVGKKGRRLRKRLKKAAQDLERLNSAKTRDAYIRALKRYDAHVAEHAGKMPPPPMRYHEILEALKKAAETEKERNEKTEGSENE